MVIMMMIMERKRSGTNETTYLLLHRYTQRENSFFSLSSPDSTLRVWHPETCYNKNIQWSTEKYNLCTKFSKSTSFFWLLLLISLKWLRLHGKWHSALIAPARLYLHLFCLLLCSLLLFCFSKWKWHTNWIPFHIIVFLQNPRPTNPWKWV